MNSVKQFPFEIWEDGGRLRVLAQPGATAD